MSRAPRKGARRVPPKRRSKPRPRRSPEKQQEIKARKPPPGHPNLRPAPKFEPGQSGNPGGRPKGYSILAPLLRELAADPNEHGEGKRAVRVAKRLLNRAERNKDIRNDLALMERVDGAPARNLTIDAPKTTKIIVMGVST